MVAVLKKEIQQFFGSLTGYITIILFLLINGIYLFVLKDSNLFDFGYASLNAFFELAPWVLLFLVPAISMRSFSEELKTGTFEILQTKPLTNWQITLGKYFALLFIVVIAVLPSLIYVFTIKTLSLNGGIDGGGILGSYIGLFFLAAVFASISLLCSSLTQNAVVAFLMSLFACIVLYFGFGAISRISWFENGWDYYIEMLGINFHYDSMSRGVLDSRNMLYFMSVIFVALFLTVKNLQKK